jgi:hypothetical protein
MSAYFEVKVKYQKLQQDGKQKKVTEPYLVDAVSFTDAEKRINEVLEKYISGEFFVRNMKIANYSDILPNENGDRWFKCKVSYISIDEEKGTERKTSTYMLVEANDVKSAYDFINKSMEGMVSDYTIPAISESAIMDVFPYKMSEDLAAEKYLKGEIGTGDMIESIGVDISDELKDELNN